MQAGGRDLVGVGGDPLKSGTPIVDHGQPGRGLATGQLGAGQRRRELHRGPGAEAVPQIQRVRERFVDLGCRLAGQADHVVDHRGDSEFVGALSHALNGLQLELLVDYVLDDPP